MRWKRRRRELRGLEEQRLKLEQGLQPARDKINDLKLKQQAAQLNDEQFQQRLAEVDVVSPEDEAALAAELTPGLQGKRAGRATSPG